MCTKKRGLMLARTKLHWKVGAVIVAVLVFSVFLAYGVVGEDVVDEVFEDVPDEIVEGIMEESEEVYVPLEEIEEESVEELESEELYVDLEEVVEEEVAEEEAEEESDEIYVDIDELIDEVVEADEEIEEPVYLDLEEVEDMSDAGFQRLVVLALFLDFEGFFPSDQTIADKA